jgi:uncharacterized protein (TIGR02996 family)
MNESVFLEAIVAEPDSILHRLVYADWLEDQAGGVASARREAILARAEFIRAQIERDRLHSAHPRTRALMRCEEELLARHGADWAKDVAPLVRRYRFHRGFIEEVRLSVEQLLQHGLQLFRLAPIRRLQLRGTATLPALLAQSQHRVRLLADVLSRLEVLDLNRDYLGEAAGLALLGLPRLPKLKALHLGYNALSPAGILVLAESPILASLKTLEFTASASAVESLQVLLHSPGLANLEHLSLAGARLGDRVARLLTSSPLLRRLRGLSLSHNQLTGAGLRELLSSPDTEDLESLDLSFNPLGADAARALRQAASNLTELNLSRTEQGQSGGIRLLAGSPLFSQLLALDLSLNRIDSVGGRAMCAGPEPACLLRLDLIYNDLGPAIQRDLQDRFGEEVCLFKR